MKLGLLGFIFTMERNKKLKKALVFSTTRNV